MSFDDFERPDGDPVREATAGPAADGAGAESGPPAGKRRARKAAAQVQDKIDATADALSLGVMRASEGAQQVYGRASEQVQKVSSVVEPFANERPYAAMGLALGLGFVLGRIFHGGPKVIYVKPRT